MFGRVRSTPLKVERIALNFDVLENHFSLNGQSPQMIETNIFVRKRTWLFFGVSAGLCAIVYWFGFSQEKYNDEITLAISACTLTGIYFIFVRPLARALQTFDRQQSTLYNNLKLKSNDQDRSFLTYIYRVNLLFDQCRQFVGSLRSTGVDLPFDEEFRENLLVKVLIDLKAETKLVSERESQRQWVSDSMSKFFELLKRKNEDNSDL